jgi:hypothetical protein
MLERKRSETLQLFRRSFVGRQNCARGRLRQRLHTWRRVFLPQRKTHFVTNLTETQGWLFRLTVWWQATQKLVPRLPKDANKVSYLGTRAPRKSWGHPH